MVARVKLFTDFAFGLLAATVLAVIAFLGFWVLQAVGHSLGVDQGWGAVALEELKTVGACVTFVVYYTIEIRNAWRENR
jgi:hypothetical protein